MRNVGLIMMRELASYLRTPSGYFIGAMVLLLHGLLFNGFAIMDIAQPSGEVLRRFLYTGGIVTMVGGVLFSMRLLAEETASGADVLLLTSPISETEVVLGKYLSALAFLTLVTLLSVYLPALIFVNGKVSVGHIACGYLGMVLLGATTLAIGTFASSLTPHPFLTVILTAAIVVVMELCYLLGQAADPPASELVATFAMHSSHFSSFQRGILDLSDVVFFASVSYVSIFGAIKVLGSRRWR